ncbi:hypothetical protein AgCh_025000 [Apium graveolens]
MRNKTNDSYHDIIVNWIYDLDFDEDPSRTLDLDFSRNFNAYLFPCRKEFNLNPGLIYLDFDLNPGLDFDLNPGALQAGSCGSGRQGLSMEEERIIRLQGYSMGRKIFQFNNSPDKNPGWVSLNQRPTVLHIVNGKSISENNLGWKKDFLYVLWEGGDWGTLFRSCFGLAVDGSPNDMVLSEEETKAFNLLTQDNGTSHSWDLIRETVLVERGLSPVPKKMAEKIEEATKPKDLETTRMKRVGKVFKDPRLRDHFP